MRRLCLVWSLVAALAALLAAQGMAGAGACLTQTCKCDDDCSGLVCSADGRCCGPPVTGTPCKADGGGGGAGGASGSDAGTPPASGSSGCHVGGAAGSGAGVATSLLVLGALGAARRRAQRRR